MLLVYSNDACGACFIYSTKHFKFQGTQKPKFTVTDIFLKKPNRTPKIGEGISC